MILVVFGILTLVFDSWRDALFLGIVVANIAIGSFQVIRSKRELDRLLKSVESGGLEVRLRTDELESVLTRAQRVGNRIAAAVLAAAVTDGLAGLAVDRRRRRRGSRTQRFGG